MKKWTNQAIIETTRYPLSEDDVYLLGLEMAEIKESAAGKKASSLSCRFNAIYAGTTRNMHTYLAEELEASAAKWTTPYEKPVCVNHDVYGAALGRIKEATFMKQSEVDGVLSLRASVVDQDAIDKIHDERYLTVSVGVRSKNVECSICGVNWFEEECDHIPGKSYFNLDGQEALCTAIIRDIDPIELSFVNVPADADEEKFAGLVWFGEAEDFEFFSETEGVSRRSRKKSDKVSDDIALALKESFDEFLSLLNTEGNESQDMKELTKTTDPVAEDENLDATAAEGSDNASVDESANSQEESADGAQESTDASEESEDTSDATALEGILDEEEEADTTEEPTTEENSEVDSRIVELQSRVQELETENLQLKADITAQNESASKWFKSVRKLLGEHLADLKFALGKATEDFDALEATEAQKKIKDQISEIRELRKEFKETDFSIAPIFSQNGVLENETLVSGTDNKETGNTKSEPEHVMTLDESFVSALSATLSNSRPYKRIGH
jgi:hypothetical protein